MELQVPSKSSPSTSSWPSTKGGDAMNSTVQSSSPRSGSSGGGARKQPFVHVAKDPLAPTKKQSTLLQQQQQLHNNAVSGSNQDGIAVALQEQQPLNCQNLMFNIDGNYHADDEDSSKISNSTTSRSSHRKCNRQRPNKQTKRRREPNVNVTDSKGDSNMTEITTLVVSKLMKLIHHKEKEQQQQGQQQQERQHQKNRRKLQNQQRQHLESTQQIQDIQPPGRNQPEQGPIVIEIEDDDDDEDDEVRIVAMKHSSLSVDEQLDLLNPIQKSSFCCKKQNRMRQQYDNNDTRKGDDDCSNIHHDAAATIHLSTISPPLIGANRTGLKKSIPKRPKVSKAFKATTVTTTTTTTTTVTTASNRRKKTPKSGNVPRSNRNFIQCSSPSKMKESKNHLASSLHTSSAFTRMMSKSENKSHVFGDGNQNTSTRPLGVKRQRKNASEDHKNLITPDSRSSRTCGKTTKHRTESDDMLEDCQMLSKNQRKQKKQERKRKQTASTTSSELQTDVDISDKEFLELAGTLVDVSLNQFLKDYVCSKNAKNGNRDGAARSQSTLSFSCEPILKSLESHCCTSYRTVGDDFDHCDGQSPLLNAGCLATLVIPKTTEKWSVSALQAQALFDYEVGVLEETYQNRMNLKISKDANNVTNSNSAQLNSSEPSSFLSALWDREFPIEESRRCAMDDKYDWTLYTRDSDDDVAISMERYRNCCRHYCCDGNDDCTLWSDHCPSLIGGADYYWWNNDNETLQRMRVQRHQMQLSANYSPKVQVQQNRTDETTVCTKQSVAATIGNQELEHYLNALHPVLAMVPPPRLFTKLRRILLPMLFKVEIIHDADILYAQDEQEKDGIVSSYTAETTVVIAEANHSSTKRSCVGIYQLNKSLADLWLSLPETRGRAALCLLQIATKIPYYDDHDRSMEDRTIKNHEQYFDTQTRFQYQELQNLILGALRKIGTSCQFHGRSVLLNDNLKYGDIPACPVLLLQHQRANPFQQNTEDSAFGRKREKIIEEYSADEDNDPPELLFGNVLLTEETNGITESQFLEEAYIMQKVNTSFPRYFIPTVSRPRFARITHFDRNVVGLKKLHDVFFDDEGRLRESVCFDVSRFSNHNFITFSNENGGGLRDKRWQVPFNHHTSDELSRTRRQIEEIATEVQLINPRYEHMHDLGILIGGTVDQSLHHDLSRQWTVWKQTRSSMGNQEDEDPSPLLGWEANRLVYNREMADTYAPSSFLIGLKQPNQHENKSKNIENNILIGVQRDQIEEITSHSCRIINGNPYETFRIVRDDRDIVVLEVKHGCCFTGDFQHAGVRNVKQGSDDEELLSDFFGQLASIVRMHQNDNLRKRNDDVLKMLRSFKKLDRLCRLHFSTEKTRSKMIIPRDAIGFDCCVANGGSEVNQSIAQ